jgi:hypothetical protein
MRKAVQIVSLLVGAALLGAVSMPTWAVDGVVLIDQNKAMAGGVTPGDAPGFPVTISLPGSYRLAGNLTVPDANTDAIVITSNNVTLDLNGFAILGPTVCGRSGGGSSGSITCSPTGTGNGVNGPRVNNITVTNGTIRGMGASGISLIGSTSSPGSPPSTVQKMAVHSNGDNGIGVDTGLIANNVTGTNGSYGIATNLANVIGNYSTNNNFGGLFIGSGGYANNVFLLNGFNSNGSSVEGGGTSLGHQNLCGGFVC